MNSFLCLTVLFAVASATHHHTVHKQQPLVSSWGLYAPEKPKEWDGSYSYVSPVPTSGYWPGYYSPSVFGSPISHSHEIHHAHGVPHSHAVPHSHGIHHAHGVHHIGSQNYKVVPSTWSDESYVPSQAWSGFYSAGVPVAKVEKQVTAPKPVVAAPVASVAKVDGGASVSDVVPKLIQYSTEITHDVPAKKEDVVSPVVPATRTVSVVPQAAPVSNDVSAPIQYSAWSGEVAKPVAGSWASDVKPATWTSGVKPASWTSGVKPATWGSEIKPVEWTSEVKPASWGWAEPKPTWNSGAWAADVKPASWSSWSEPKPWGSYGIAPVQPAFYGASYGQPIVTNAHHAIPTPWSSTWSSTWSSAHPVSWTEPIQKRSERQQF